MLHSFNDGCHYRRELIDHLAYTYQAVKLVTSSLYEDIHSLESRCSEFEAIQLKLELDFKRQQSTTTSDEDATLNEFLCYQGTSGLSWHLLI